MPDSSALAKLAEKHGLEPEEVEEAVATVEEVGGEEAATDPGVLEEVIGYLKAQRESMEESLRAHRKREAREDMEAVSKVLARHYPNRGGQEDKDMTGVLASAREVLEETIGTLKARR